MIDNLRKLEKQLDETYGTFLDIKISTTASRKKEIENLMKKDTSQIRKQLGF